MSSTAEELRTARIVKRGFAGLFIFVGVLAVNKSSGAGSPPADLVAGLVSIGFGGALWFNLSWARWFALGACFLAMVMAGALPALLFLREPLAAFPSDYPSNSAPVSNALLSVLGLAFAAIGYKGLEYFRSELAREDYSRRNVSVEDLTPERSTAVVYSAGVWIVLLAFAWSTGMTRPDWLLVDGSRTHSGETRNAQGKVEKLTYFDVPRFENVSAADSAAMPAGYDLPDLVPLGLCIRNANDGVTGSPVRMIDLAFTNSGKWGRDTYHYSSSERDGGPVTRDNRDLELPPSNGLALIQHAEDTNYGENKTVRITLDPDARIEERNEANNTAAFQVFRNPDGSAALPPCHTLRLRFK